MVRWGWDNDLVINFVSSPIFELKKKNQTEEKTCQTKELKKGWIMWFYFQNTPTTRHWPHVKSLEVEPLIIVINMTAWLHWSNRNLFLFSDISNLPIIHDHDITCCYKTLHSKITNTASGKKKTTHSVHTYCTWHIFHQLFCFIFMF